VIICSLHSCSPQTADGAAASHSRIAQRFAVAVMLLLGMVSFDSRGAQPASTGPVIRVGIESGTSALSHADKDGQPSGFLVDLVQEIAKERNLQVVLDYRTWNELLADFKAGKIDVIANMVFTPERNQYADFSIAHLVLPGTVFIRKGDTSITSAEDLRTKRIAAVPHGFSEEYAIKQGWGREFIASATLEDGLDKIEAGQADFVLGTKVFADNSIRQKRLTHVAVAPFSLSDLRFQYHFAVLKGHDDLLYELNTGIIAIRHNGVHDDLYEKWFGPLEPRKIRWGDLRPYQLPTLIVVLALGLAFWRQLSLLRKMRLQAVALKTSEERLTLVLEGSQDAFWDWDVTNDHVTRSERWAVMLGIPPTEISAGIESLSTLIHPDDLTRVRQARNRLVQQGHGRVEYRMRGRNDQWLWILDRGKVVARDAGGRPTRVTGAASDITARKRIEEALGRSQTLLEQSQRAAEIGGWEYDAANGVMYWTFQAFRIHDLDPDAGTPNLEGLFQFYTPQAQPVIRKAFQTALEQAQSFDIELELVTANQRSIWVRTIGRAEKNASQVIRVYGSFQDITYRKKAEEERENLQSKMLEAQKLESLGVLAGGIAHDFNNLLTVIMGNASLARESPSMVKDSLEQIETATQRAADLCRQMLAYAGKSRTTMESTDLNNIVTETVHLLRLSISKNATLDFALAQQSLPVEADTSQIRQVIMNLVINASDALGNSAGRIRVSTSRVQVTADMLREARLGEDLSPGEFVSFEVQDDGCGMNADTLARIFDPFFTTKFAGRGLGLAAVLGIVRAHKGAFFVQSTVGKGSVFRMLLPPTTKPLATRNPNIFSPAAPQSVVKPGVFLVVDDESHVRKLAGNILEHLGHTVALASDGYEALALTLARGDKYTAILLDLTMPGLDGQSTLRELRQMKLDIPVLIMSGYSEYDVRQRFPDDPFLGFLPKPFTAEDLEQRLKTLLSRKTPSKN